MSSDIPEYYRHLIEQQPTEVPNPHKALPLPPPALPGIEGATTYRGPSFTLALPEPWEDKTIFVFAGPVSDDIQHSLTLVIDQDVPVDTLIDYVDWQMMALEDELQGFRLLKREAVTLANGMPAYRLIYRWSPTEQRPLYQEQLYILHEQTGYKLTATFSKKTRKTLGPSVERLMLSFDPSS